MAIVKHIKNRNANYSAAINYLLFEHDEKTGKKIVDESGRSILRKEFYIIRIRNTKISRVTTTLSVMIQPMLPKTHLPESEHKQSV